MYSFCPHCGQSIDQNQVVGKMVVCVHCGEEIGMVRPISTEKVVVDMTEQAIQGGQAGRCPVCQQAVALKNQSLVPHFTTGGVRKMCPGSGKPIGGAVAGAAAAGSTGTSQNPPATPATPNRPPPRIMSSGKDLSKYTTRDVIRVVCCKASGEITIEELTLDYLDKNDRVRIQIEALRDLLGPQFRLQNYPSSLNKPQLAVWGNAKMCVVARKHDQGGFQPASDAELNAIVSDLQQQQPLFFLPSPPPK